MNVQDYLKKKLGNPDESDQALQNQAMVDELAQKQAEAQQLSEDTSQYGSILNLTKALAMNPNVQGPEEFLKRRQAEINKPVEDLQAKQKMQMSLSDQVREHLMKGLGAQQTDQSRMQDAAFKTAAQEQDKKKFAHNVLMDEYGLGLKEAELKQRGELEGQKLAAKSVELPKAEEHLVNTLATKNANKISIKSQLDAAMENWDKLPSDQKVAQGRQLLKTLNSAEGADAIGTEEARRLGAKLEFAMGNFTNSNPTQFGRDLEGFAQQVRDTSKSIGQAVKTNERLIADVHGKYGAKYIQGLPGTPADAPMQMTPEQRRARIQELRAKVK